MSAVMFCCGALFGAFIAAMFLPRYGDRRKNGKNPRPEIGSRWEFRGSEGDVVIVEGSTLLFVNDTGGRQVAPVDYFMATAKPRWSPSEEKKP